MRALEVTVVAHDAVVPWHHPARRELQFGEWLRHDLEAGIVEPARVDHDLAILLTKVRQQCRAGWPAGGGAFRASTRTGFCRRAAGDGRAVECRTGLARRRVQRGARARAHLVQRRDRQDRAWIAATWVLERLPQACRPVVAAARAAYLGGEEDVAILSANPCRIHRLRAANGRVDAVDVAADAARVAGGDADEDHRQCAAVARACGRAGCLSATRRVIARRATCCLVSPLYPRRRPSMRRRRA